MIIVFLFVLFFSIISLDGNVDSPGCEHCVDDQIPNSLPTRAPSDGSDVRINLISPLNGSTLRSPKVELSWTYDSVVTTDISFQVYFGESSPPVLHVWNQQKTNLVIDGLSNNKEYYWYVKPLENEYKYTLTPGGPWVFNVDVPTSDLEEYFKVDISGDKWLYMAPGDRKVASLQINNQGIYNDTFILSVNTYETPLSEWLIVPTKWVPKKTEVKEKIILRASGDARYGYYEVSIIATSINSGEEVMDLHTIHISIQKNKGTNGALEESDETYSTSVNDILYMCCIIFGVIFIVIFIPLIYKYKVKGSEQQKSVQRFPTPPPPVQSQPSLPPPAPPPIGEPEKVPLEFEIPKPPPEATYTAPTEPTTEPVKAQQKKHRTKRKTSKTMPKPSTEIISSSELSKLRIQHEELNEKLYTLESEKAMGKVSKDEFEKRKWEIVKEFLRSSEE